VTNAAGQTDDVDLGWDEAPGSVTEPAPAAEGATPKLSEIRALRSREEPTPAREELPSARELEPPDFRRRQVGPAVILAAIGASVALLVASVASSQFPRVAEPSSGVDVTRLPEPPVAQQRPEPRSPEPAPPSIVTSAAPSASAREAAVEPARASAVTVTVKVVPENSVIFRAAEKLGSGALEVSVEHDAKQYLTAFHDGYVPAHFTLDGSRDTVTVRLQRVPSPPPSATTTSDSPFLGE